MSAHEDYVRKMVNDGLGYTPPEQPVTGWVSIVYLDGDEGHELVRKIERAEGVVYHGPTDETIAAAVEELKAWDYGDESEYNITADPQWGGLDYLARVDDYVLAWSPGLGYASLSRRVGAE